MPFTGSHPAAVLPLTYLGLSTSALVVGSMAADLPYFLPGLPDRTQTHSVVGVLTTDPLIGLVCLALWHTLIAPLVLAVAPAPVRCRIPPAPPARPRRPQPSDLVAVLLLWVALVLGSATHVLWDEFTHDGHFGARHVAWLATQHGPLPGYRWAQYASGVVGAVLLALALWRWWRAAPLFADPGSALPPRAIAAVWAAVLGSTLAGSATGVVTAMVEDLGLRRALFLAATWGGGAGLLVVGLLAVAVAPRITAHRRHHPQPVTHSTQ